MVITDKFVYIHKPKTGGTFVTDALLRLHDGKWNFLMHGKLAVLKEIHFRNKLGTLTINDNKHGGCREIPEKYGDRVIVSTIRNPFDYYVSQYEFGWWKRKEWLKNYQRVGNFAERFGSFPDLTFSQFMELMAAAFNDAPHQDFQNDAALGRYTVEFIKDHFYNPDTVITKLSGGYIESGQYKQDMYPVTFIFTHQLNRQLHDYLFTKGYPKDSIEFILNKEKVLPQGKGRSKEQKWEKYYTPELKELVYKKDWLLFKLFPEFREIPVS